MAPWGVHVATGDGPVIVLVGQVVVIQLFALLAACGTHDDAPIGPAVFVGQVIAVQLLAFDAVCTAQLPLGTFEFPLPQVVIVQLLALVADDAEQLWTGMSVVTTVLQLTA